MSDGARIDRFLEMMARTLEMDISEMGPESLKWKEDIDISSMCSVFAESEVISLIADNHSDNDIVHEDYSIGDRIGQIIIVPYPKVSFVEVDELSETERGIGGFGSTNK